MKTKAVVDASSVEFVWAVAGNKLNDGPTRGW
jgi:hypothetical protein